jgi:hypothetical protein
MKHSADLLLRIFHRYRVRSRFEALGAVVDEEGRVVGVRVVEVVGVPGDDACHARYIAVQRVRREVELRWDDDDDDDDDNNNSNNKMKK